MGKPNRLHAISLAAVMALAISVPFAIAQTNDTGGQKAPRTEGRRHGMRGAGFFGNLDLTEAQKAQMKQIRDSHSQTIRPLMEQIRAKRQEIHQASQSGAFNESVAAQELTEIAPLEAKLMGEEFRTHQEMLSVLTPDQKAKLEQLRQQAKTRWSERKANKQSSK